ncbi:glycosyltransferase family 2 protein [Protaetiibacter larvae]|uniref:Glycosyltransferase family 2 protein n=1 Tax=Protaetiibacter larvae TaxID=2592654 RepID=A0A5C1Y464_9MICO|nr:glycosyltransferase family 2 protein [Protaetiibacter larvae]QEO08634.1 glycosyltransferase family 2 protein [Protaetiibacter larvae]
MTPRVSIVVPAYNNGAYIARTMDSILAQTFTDLEIIVADHTSTDDTAEVLARYADEPRLTLLTTPAGGGAVRNWNTVSQAATGEFVKLVCGDDLIHPELVAAQVEALDAAPTAVLSASRRDIVDAADRPMVRGRGLGGLSGLVPGRKAIQRTVRQGTNIFGEPGCVLMRRSVLERVGWWDDRFPYLIDQATYTRVLLEGDFAAVDRSLASFRVSDSQWSVRLARSQAQQAIAYHRWLREEHPHVVSASDARRGDLAARAMATARRAVYLVMARRMREAG